MVSYQFTFVLVQSNQKSNTAILATWQAQPVEMEEAQDFANRLQKI